MQLAQFPLEEIEKRNTIIKELAIQYKIPFIDSYALQDHIWVHREQNNSWKHKNLVRVLDAIIMLFFPFCKDALSRKRRLDLTVDGVHYNSISAKKIAAYIDDAIKNLQ
ncbi:hypothetical protein [Anaerosporobacter faecicola]|uniref:hypothetical protein n=1 Tax=Anaerosporobacter faecicola TaxID=2718714 RepID=UPI00143B8C56|nr:hypothetical protein [Anaerosporobacter faecicola]